MGIGGGKARADVVPMWTVDNIERSVDTVRAKGGTATDVERQPYGLSSYCTDNQGLRFYLGQF
jgi:hypothetical protein